MAFSRHKAASSTAARLHHHPHSEGHFGMGDFCSPTTFDHLRLPPECAGATRFHRPSPRQASVNKQNGPIRKEQARVAVTDAHATGSTSVLTPEHGKARISVETGLPSQDGAEDRTTTSEGRLVRKDCLTRPLLRKHNPKTCPSCHRPHGNQPFCMCGCPLKDISSWGLLMRQAQFLERLKQDRDKARREARALG